MKRIFYIDIGYACFGIIAIDGVVKDAAPIAKWMLGKKFSEIKPFLIKKHAKVAETLQQSRLRITSFVHISTFHSP